MTPKQDNKEGRKYICYSKDKGWYFVKSKAEQDIALINHKLDVLKPSYEKTGQ